MLTESRFAETFLLQAQAAEPRPRAGRRGMLGEGLVRKWVWPDTTSHSIHSMPNSRYPRGLHRTHGYRSNSFPLIPFEMVNISSHAAWAVGLRVLNAKLLVAFWEPVSSFSYNSSASKLLLGESGISLPPTLLTPAGHCQCSAVKDTAVLPPTLCLYSFFPPEFLHHWCVPLSNEITDLLPGGSKIVFDQISCWGEMRWQPWWQGGCQWMPFVSTLSKFFATISCSILVAKLGRCSLVLGGLVLRLA